MGPNVDRDVPMLTHCADVPLFLFVVRCSPGDVFCAAVTCEGVRIGEKRARNA